MSALRVWIARPGGAPEPATLRAPAGFGPEGLAAGIPGAAKDGRGAAACAIVPARGGEGACAALIVPRGHEGRVALGGVGVASGLHLLRHGARVEAGGTTLWVSAAAGAEERAYDPAQDGEDLFCFRTKARLAPGEAIVRCPGTPAGACGLAYRRAAWELRLPCPACGHDPSTPEWRPVLQRNKARRIDELLQLVRAG